MTSAPSGVTNVWLVDATTSRQQGGGPHVVIVGGGIGGMTLALSLHDAGITDVDIYESSSATRELGVGINILPHAVRELDELGLLEELELAGLPTAELVYYSEHGQRIWSEPRGKAAGYRWPQLSIHRGRLLRVLARAVDDRLGSDRVHHGHHLHGFETVDGRPRATFLDRMARDHAIHVDGDVLVGCDGVNSTVRAALVPDEGPPEWNGITIWRGVTEAPPYLTGRTMIMAGYLERRIVAYPIGPSPAHPGQVLVNWLALRKIDDGRPMPPQDWGNRAEIGDVLDEFGDYVFDFLDFPQLARDAYAVFQYPMIDRLPLTSWNGHGVTLLGDAAHPMHPVGSNGSSQAIIDARVLARQLALADSVDEALHAYESDRLPATAMVVLANRRAGPEVCMELAHERAPDGFDRIEDVFAPGELDSIAAEYKATAGFSVDELNDRPSLSVSRPRE